MASAFEYLCRVCAANTKGKNSVPECVYILKTPALKDKIEKFLYLTISEDDILPKVLCKACYRQVEATASLSKIAKHTQKVFRDFIFNTKSYLQAESSESSTSPEVTTTAPTRTLTAPANTFTAPVSNFTAPATAHSAPAPIFSSPASIFTAPASTFKAPPAIFTAPTPTPTTTTTTAPVVPVQAKPKPKEKDKPIVKSVELITPTSQPPPSKCSHKDDVILNVSVNDPLTRETQHKMITASRRQNSLDSRYTPKSIAQRGFTSTPKQPESITPTKKQTTSGVINFFPNRPQQVTTVTSGGYVIGCTPSSAPTSKAATSDQPAPAPASAPPTNTLQQKRKNLKTALNNSKTSNAGQVSLLKVSQKAAVAAAPTKSSQPPKVVEPPTVLVEDDVPAEPLPEKMIIAATKQQKHLTQVAPTAPTAPQPTPPNEPESEQQPQTEPTDLSQPFRTNIPDDILLGKVIKDGDLLKLILKALKWPVKRNNMEAQLERLRNSRFAHIMADPNLLQDADLTQIMGPYLGPVLQAAQMLQQQQQIAAAAAAAAVTKETELQMAGITTSLPYKLPAETSVQLVPASPEAEAEEADAAAAKKSTSTQSLKRDAGKASAKRAPPRKVRKMAPRGRSASTFNSDEYAALNSTLNSQYLSPKSAPDIPVDLDPSALFTQLSLLSGLSASSSNEALLALLERQRVALSRLQQQQQQPQPQPPAQARRQRSNSIITVPASGSDFLFDTDDIILMEPDDCLENTTTNLQNNLDNNTGSSSAISQSGPVNTFPVPQPVSKTMITRPIIKRRKTVIQASPARTNLAINTQPVPPAYTKPAESVITNATRTKVSTSVTNLMPSLSAATAPPQKKISKTQSLDSLNTIATQYPSNIISSGTQAPSNTTNVSVSEAAATAIMTKATETALIVTASAATSVSSLVASTSASNVTAVSTVAAEKSTTRSSSSSTKRQSTSKLALGQQLLEAICLQTIAAETKDIAVVPAGAAGGRGSVQQIRSALKKSLQKAQEQQQQRNKKAAPATIDEENVERNVNIVREVVEQPRSRHRGNMPAGQLDVEEEINRITLVLQSKAKEDKKIEEADKRLTAAASTRIPGIRRKIVPTTRNRRPTVTLLVADEIVDLVADEDNQDSADGKSADNDKGNENDKEKETTASNKPKEKVKTYLNAASLATLQRSQKSDTKEQKAVTPMHKRGRNIQLDESDDDDDDEDNKPLKPRTEKHSDEKQEVGSRTSTPASWQRSESATNTLTSARPSRVSKTMSRYYKGPDKSPGTTSRSTMATRSRFRN
ncbi:PREDICTED: mucin-5AC [Rhagoletis zephyria]|uniref:mucin-5AC n=1 Tax=Rhagoletis zephyria TaxID=28612 RepID=UPI000811866D|nr:PREDICTED: mucin-5AC [Rhagoletis zephyria]